MTVPQALSAGAEGELVYCNALLLSEPILRRSETREAPVSALFILAVCLPLSQKTPRKKGTQPFLHHP